MPPGHRHCASAIVTRQTQDCSGDPDTALASYLPRRIIHRRGQAPDSLSLKRCLKELPQSCQMEERTRERNRKTPHGGRALQEFILQGACPQGACPQGACPPGSVPSGEHTLQGRARSAGRWVDGREGGPEAAVLAPVGEIQAQSRGAESERHWPHWAPSSGGAGCPGPVAACWRPTLTLAYSRRVCAHSVLQVRTLGDRPRTPG